MQANQILPYARSLFALAESTGETEYDENQQSYTVALADYTLAYVPDVEVFWLEHRGERLLSALWQQEGDRASSWSLDNLDDLGNLTHADVRWFAEWTTWLSLRAQAQMQQTQEYLEAGQIPSQPDYER